MSELDSTTKARHRSGWVMWLIWVAATCAGILVVGALRSAMVMLAGFPVPRGDLDRILLTGLVWPGVPLFVGTTQHLVLGFFLPGERRWFGGTLLGAVVGILVGFILLFVGTFVGMAIAGDMNITYGEPYDKVGLLLGLLLPLSIFQWLVLQRHGRRTGWWLLASFLGWCAAAIVAWVSLNAFGGVVEGVSQLAVALAVSLVAGILIGSITGAALVSILWAGPPHASTALKRPPTQSDQAVGHLPEVTIATAEAAMSGAAPALPLDETATLQPHGQAAARPSWKSPLAIIGVVAVIYTVFFGYRGWQSARQGDLTQAAIVAGPVFVPAGEFCMGSAEGDKDARDDEKPQHTVYLDAFWIDRVEVTNAMYARCVEAGACQAPPRACPEDEGNHFGKPEYENYPVNCVSWLDAQAYCRWTGGRLPTEAEWEKAARGTDGRIYPWGNEAPDCGRLNFGNNKKECVRDISPVGAYPSGASPYAALDMGGNVEEWVADWYDEKYYNISPPRNPTGPPSGRTRGLRGGSYAYYSPDWSVRVMGRQFVVPDRALGHVGFRCARSE